MLARAGERAASLAAAAEARRYFEQAAELADEPIERAALLDRRRRDGLPSRRSRRGQRLLEQSIALYEREGETHAAARALGISARVDRFTGRRDEALARMEQAFEVISDDEPDEDLALLAAGLAVSYWFSGDLERAAERAEMALDIAERQALPVPLAEALGPRAPSSTAAGIRRSRRHSWSRRSRVALEHDLTRGREHSLLHPLRPVLPARRVRRGAVATSTSRWRSRGGLGVGRTSGASSRSGPTRCSCSGAGTRRSPPLSEFTEEQLDSAGE